MSTDPFHLNRTVHLARRDALYEKAVRRILHISVRKCPQEQCQLANEAFYLLTEAHRHAEIANLAGKTSTQSKLFEQVLGTLIDNTQSLSRMLRRRLVFGHKDNHLNRFFGAPEIGEKVSSHYIRCAGLILRGLKNIVHSAETPFKELSKTSIAKMTSVDKARYEKAYTHFFELADSEAAAAAERQ